MTDSRLEFWDQRAWMGPTAGTQDRTLKELEMRAIIGHIGTGRRILDAGCGTGETARAIVQALPDAQVCGFDYSAANIEHAQEHRDWRLTFRVGELALPPYPDESFDVVLTERALINMDNAEQQAIAIRALVRLTKPGGKLILCESFLDGLDEINAFREPAGLEPIKAPWHNTYFGSVASLIRMVPEDADLETRDPFSGTYYFLSRVINAWAALPAEPDYDAPINRLALDLPAMNHCAQTKIVVLRKLHP